MQKFKLYKQLYFQVLISIFIGALFGHFYPDLAIKMKPLGEGFIKLIRMMVPPIIFTTVTIGIANMKNIKEAGRIGIKALLYFEIVTIIAMLIGLIVANYYQPGAGLNINIHSLDTNSIASYTTSTASFNTVTFLQNIIPDTLVSAFTKGDILPVLFISILFGFGLLQVGEKVKPIVIIIEQISNVLFSIVGFIMKIAPIGAFGAMAYAIGTHGIHTLAILFIAQAFNIHLTLTQQFTIVIVLLLTSKGAATITGGGFIALATAVTSLHIVPVEGLVLLLGIDRFMSEARSLTNLIGNGIATIVIAKWEGNFDIAAAKKILISSNEKSELDYLNLSSL